MVETDADTIPDTGGFHDYQDDDGYETVEQSFQNEGADLYKGPAN